MTRVIHATSLEDEDEAASRLALNTGQFAARAAEHPCHQADDAADQRVVGVFVPSLAWGEKVAGTAICCTRPRKQHHTCSPLLDKHVAIGLNRRIRGTG